MPNDEVTEKRDIPGRVWVIQVFDSTSSRWKTRWYDWADAHCAGVTYHLHCCSTCSHRPGWKAPCHVSSRQKAVPKGPGWGACATKTSENGVPLKIANRGLQQWAVFDAFLLSRPLGRESLTDTSPQARFVTGMTGSCPSIPLPPSAMLRWQPKGQLCAGCPEDCSRQDLLYFMRVSIFQVINPESWAASWLLGSLCRRLSDALPAWLAEDRQKPPNLLFLLPNPQCPSSLRGQASVPRSWLQQSFVLPLWLMALSLAFQDWNLGTSFSNSNPPEQHKACLKLCLPMLGPTGSYVIPRGVGLARQPKVQRGLARPLAPRCYSASGRVCGLEGL